MKRAHLVALVAVLTPMLAGCVVATSTSSSSGGGGGGGLFVLVIPLLLLFFVMRLVRRSRQGSRPITTAGANADRSPSVSMLRAELSVLADDVLRLDPQI